jgi:hypothetical protein
MIIASDDDLTFDGNAHPIKLLVIFRHTIVDVDKRSGDIAVDGVGVVSGKLLGLLIRGGILRKSGLLELGGEFRAAFDEFDEALPGCGKENVELLYVGVETKFLEFRGDPFGVVFVVGRADVVRVGGEALHVGTEVVRARDGAELFFPLALGARRLRGISIERLLVGDDVMADRREREACEQE